MSEKAFDDPLDLFDAARDALQREDWEAVASLCDPASLSSFARGLITTFTDPPKATPDDYLSQDPGIPPDVADYFVKRHGQLFDPEFRIRMELPGINTLGTLREADGTRVFQAWLEGRSPGHQCSVLAKAGLFPSHLVEDVLRRSGEASWPVALGFAEAGPMLVHVVYHWPAPGAAEKIDPGVVSLPADERALVRDLAASVRPSVTTCRKQPDGGWLLVASRQFPGPRNYMNTAVPIGFGGGERPLGTGPV